MDREKEEKAKDQMEEEKAEKVEEERTGGQQQVELPPVNFENFVLDLYNMALIHLGVRDPETGKLIRNLTLARHTIDTLGMIQEKTKGNLTAPENNLLENLLYKLRMGYLHAVKQEEEASKETTEQGEPAQTQPKSEAQGPSDSSEP